MESRNFITAREMVLSGNYILPTMNGAYRFEKPPLPTWFVAFFMKITGNISSEWIMRIPVAILSLCLIFWMYKLVRRITENNFLAFIVSTLLATTFLIMKEGIISSWDMFSYALIFGVVVYLVEGLKTEKKINYIKAGILLGMAIMSKGPVPIYGLFLPFFISYGIIYKWENYRKNWKYILGVFIIGIGLAAIWPGLIILNNRELFFEVMKKEGKTWTEKFVRSYFFYFDYMGLTGIWALFSIGAICYPWSKKRINSDNEKIFKFGIIWTVLTLVLLSLVNMKKQRYGIPIYIASGVPTGVLVYSYYMGKLVKLTKLDKIIFIIQEWLIKIILIVMPLVYYIYGIKKNKLHFVVFFIYVIIYYGVLFIFSNLLKKRKEERIKIIIIFSVISMLMLHTLGVWFIEKNVRVSKKDPNMESLQVLQNTKMDLPLYAIYYKIEDVWNIGRSIKQIEREPYEKPVKKIEVKENEKQEEKKLKIKRLTELPDKFILVGKEHEIEESLEDYDIITSKEYYRFNKKKETITVFELEKKKFNK